MFLFVFIPKNVHIYVINTLWFVASCVGCLNCDTIAEWHKG